MCLHLMISVILLSFLLFSWLSFHSRILSLKIFLLAVKALQKLKGALGLPLRLGWNGDPCVPEQHPWSGVDCQYNRSIGKHVIDGLYVLHPYLGFYMKIYQYLNKRVISFIKCAACVYLLCT